RGQLLWQRRPRRRDLAGARPRVVVGRWRRELVQPLEIRAVVGRLRLDRRRRCGRLTCDHQAHNQQHRTTPHPPTLSRPLSRATDNSRFPRMRRFALLGLILSTGLSLAPAALAAPPEIQRHVSPNGLEVLVAENHALPLVTVELAVK